MLPKCKCSHEAADHMNEHNKKTGHIDTHCVMCDCHDYRTISDDPIV